MNTFRLVIALLSSLVYVYTALTVYRMPNNATRVMRSIIAVYAFTIAVANIVSLDEPTLGRTYLTFIASVLATVWVIGDVVIRLRSGKPLLRRVEAEPVAEIRD